MGAYPEAVLLRKEPSVPQTCKGHQIRKGLNILYDAFNLMLSAGRGMLLDTFAHAFIGPEPEQDVPAN